EFNKYADESTWNEEAKMDAFMAGLKQEIAIKILEMFPGPRDLFSLQTIASRIDSRLYTRSTFFQNYRNNKQRQNNFKKQNTNSIKN
ncbi:hypothetical protein PIROE2DRAFT_29393, partial [Piromyces sp. E2]